MPKHFNHFRQKCYSSCDQNATYYKSLAHASDSVAYDSESSGTSNLVAHAHIVKFSLCRGFSPVQFKSQLRTFTKILSRIRTFLSSRTHFNSKIHKR